MNTTLWTLQILLSIAFATSGLLILLLPKEKLEPRLSWVKKYSDNERIFICLAKLAGAIGLIVPMYFNVLPGLTPAAALGIAAIMILALRYHLRTKEYSDLPAPALFLIVALLVAYYRF